MQFWESVVNSLPKKLADRVHTVAESTDFPVREILRIALSWDSLETILLEALDDPKLSVSTCQEIVAHFQPDFAVAEKARHRWDEIILRELGTVSDCDHAKIVYFDANNSGEAVKRVAKVWDKLAVARVNALLPLWEKEPDFEARVQMVAEEFCCVLPGGKAEARLRALSDDYTSCWASASETEDDLRAVLRLGTEYSLVGKLAKAQAFSRLVGMLDKVYQVALLWREEKARSNPDDRKIKAAEERIRQLMKPIIWSATRFDMVVDYGNRTAGRDVGNLVQDMVIQRCLELCLQTKKI